MTPDHYFLSVTTHGVLMAYVLTTFFIMGFGYFTAETSLERPLPGKPWAWLGFILGVAGTLATRRDLERPGHGSVHFLSSFDR